MPSEIPMPRTGRLDCWGFPVQADAQTVLDALPHDPYALDPDSNGIACDQDPLLIAYQDGYNDFVAAWEKPFYEPKDHEDVFVKASQDFSGITIVYNDNPARVQYVDSRPIGVSVPSRAIPGEGRPEACYANAAVEYVNETIPKNSLLRFEPDEAGGAKAYIWFQDTTGTWVMLNEVLLREGLAIYAGMAHYNANEELLRKAQKDAIENGTGLWGQC